MQKLIASLDAIFQDNTYIYHNVGIAISGGSDSVALFMAALALQEKYDLKLFAVHVEHGLRGEESIKDKEFVERICRSFNVKLFVEQLSGLSDLSSNIETEARRQRYAVFQKAYRKFQLDALLLAQHQQDQTESILMNLCRGTGLRGLRGMQKISQYETMRVIRPFLQNTKSEILQALAEQGIPYREDRSNAETIYTRNKIRLDVLPVLRSVYPALDIAFTRLSEQAFGDDAYFSKKVEAIISKNAYTEGLLCCIALEVLQKLEQPILVRLLRRLYDIALSRLEGISFSDAAYGLSYENSMALLTLCREDALQKIELPKAIFASKSKRYLHFHYDYHKINKQHLETYVGTRPVAIQDVLQRKVSFAGLRINLCNQNCIPNGKNIQSIPKIILEQASFRTRQKGDRIQPFGMQGSQSLKKYLISKKVDEEFRNQIPILAIDNEVLWVLGVGASERLRADNAQKYIVENKYPWM